MAYGDRVALVGPNGAGKTTLLGALLGRVPLASGRRLARLRACGSARSTRRGRGSPASRPSSRCVEEATGWPASECRTLLAKFGLRADHTSRPASSLSPGERTRAGLALLQAVGVNCLVLDEPTNHLDVPAIEQLEQALDALRRDAAARHPRPPAAAAVRTTRTLEVPAGQVHER